MSPTQTRALTLPAYGETERFAVQTIALPDPAAGEVRVKVHTSAINPADYKVATGAFKFLHARNFPMVLGYDFSGVVEALGPGVDGFKMGDEVFGFLPYGPMNRRGAFAEALIARAGEIAIKPAGVTHAQAAAAATPALTALQSLRTLGHLPASGGRVLVTGVSGGVGSLGVAIARRLGAGVEAVGSGSGLKLALSLGAERAIDRKQGDPIAAAQGPFDVVLDAAAAYRWRAWKGKLKSGGTYVTTLPSLSFATDKLTSLASASRVAFVNVKSRPADLRQVADWLASGMAVAVDSTIPVREVGKGIARLHSGQVLGRIVVDVAGGF